MSSIVSNLVGSSDKLDDGIKPRLPQANLTSSAQATAEYIPTIHTFPISDAARAKFYSNAKLVRYDTRYLLQPLQAQGHISFPLGNWALGSRSASQ